VLLLGQFSLECGDLLLGLCELDRRAADSRDEFMKGVAVHRSPHTQSPERRPLGTPRNLAVHSKKLDELVRPRRHAAAVRQLLAEGGYTLPGKEGRFVSQLKVRGFGSSAKPYFVRVRRDRLPQ
jgi:hypothetical protein